MRPATIKAVLGPTNTGKTHLAIQRMLGHNTGMIGLPLRLLAREVYDKVLTLKGHHSVALVTGEERIIPKRPRYWVCTTEAMPVGNGADFVAVDEIQLCGDRERGHVFTNRLLHARGQRETLFLGADTIAGVIRELVPSARFRHRNRFSKLTYSGSKRIARLPPRTALVGFSADEVYSIAEAIRRLRGGAAVVMGALSPRTRNAQVAMYQNGDVDFLVATDAIGMGLNLDLAHVAFAGLVKFDGRKVRPLAAHELAQIAGRAGRFRRPGSFGVVGDCPQLSPSAVRSIEDNRFPNMRRVQWRNSVLDFRSSEALLQSLAVESGNPTLILARESDDIVALRELSEHEGVQELLGGQDDVRLLWEVCQIPDFRNVSKGEHVALLSAVFGHLHDNGVIPDDWLHEQLDRLDHTDGDIESLSQNIAYVRTWTYSAQKAGWVNDVEFWRGRTREVEDRLSDALHERLTRRFVDTRTSVLLRQLNQKEPMAVNVDDNGQVTVEGHEIGNIDGFRFARKVGSGPQEERALKAAGAQALVQEYRIRAKRLSRSPDKELGFTEQGGLMWGDAAIGKLETGHDAYVPRLKVFVDDEAGSRVLDQVERRMRSFVDSKIETLLGPLLELRNDEELVGNVKGMAYRLAEQFGVLRRSTVFEEVKALDQDARKLLRAHGVRFGQFSVYLPAVVKPEATKLRLLLWSLANEQQEKLPAPTPGLTTLDVLADAPAGYYPICGYMDVGDTAVRVDILERLMNLLRVEDSRSGFEASAEMLSITGMSHERFASLMRGLGYRAILGERPKIRPQTEDSSEAPSAAEAAPDLAADGPADGQGESASDESNAAPEESARAASHQPQPGVSNDTSSDEESSSEQDTPPAEEVEQFYTYQWKPKPKSRPWKRRSSREMASKGAGGQRTKRPPQKRRANFGRKGRTPRDSRKSTGPPHRRPMVDHDNPFAALLSLHDRDKGGSKRRKS